MLHDFAMLCAVTAEQGEGYAPSDARASAREKESARGRRLRANLARARSCSPSTLSLALEHTPLSYVSPARPRSLGVPHVSNYIYVCVYTYTYIYVYSL